MHHRDSVSSDPVSALEGETDGIRIRDLCPSDKRKVAHLVQQLAMVSLDVIVLWSDCVMGSFSLCLI